LFHSHIILLQVVKCKFSNKVRQSYNLKMIEKMKQLH